MGVQVSQAAMEILLLILAFLLLVAGIVGVFVPMVPGPPLCYVGLLVLQWSGRGGFTLRFLWIFAVIAIAVTVMDYILPSLMAKQFGGSRFAAIGSFIGMVLGILFFFPWGLILGPFLGALIGELLHKHSDFSTALKAAFGAFLAFIVGTGVKFAACIMMMVSAIKAAAPSI